MTILHLLHFSNFCMWNIKYKIFLSLSVIIANMKHVTCHPSIKSIIEKNQETICRSTVSFFDPWIKKKQIALFRGKSVEKVYIFRESFRMKYRRGDIEFLWSLVSSSFRFLSYVSLYKCPTRARKKIFSSSFFLLLCGQNVPKKGTALDCV